MAERGRRRNNEGLLRIRKDGRWEVRLRIDGKDHTAYAKTEADALKKLRDLMDKRDKHVAVPPQRLTVKTFLDDWLPNRKADLKPQTFEGYEQIVRDHIVPGIGALRLAKLSPRDIDAFYQRTLKKPNARTGKPLSALTVKHIHEVLRKALQDATRQELIHRNPASLVSPPVAKPKKFPTFRSPAEAQAFLKVAAKDDYFALWALGLTGMREGELLGLTWDNVDFDRGVLRVQTAMWRVKGVGAMMGTPKGDASYTSERELVIHPRLMGILREHRARQEAFIAKREAEGKPVFPGVTLGLVFLGRYGGVVSTSFCGRRFRVLLKEAKLDTRMRFHDLRHSSVLVMRALGVGNTVASRRLGHSRESTTIDVYGAHDWADMQTPAAVALDSLIPGGDEVH